MNDQKKFKPLPLNILDFGKTNLYADKLDGGERRPSFSFKVIRGFVYPWVRTGLPTDIKNGIVKSKMSIRTWYVFTSLFKMVIDREKTTVRLNLFAKQYNKDTNSYNNELMPTGSLKVARDKDDKIYISLVVENRPKIQFYFGQDYDIVIKTEGGNELTEAEYSQLDAQGYWLMLKDLVPVALHQTGKSIFESAFIEDSKDANSSSSNQSSGFDDYDSDIPL